MASTVYVYFTFPRLNDTDNNLMLFLLLVISFFFMSAFFTATLFLTYKKIKRLQELENYAKALKGSLSAVAAKTTGHQRSENDSTHLAESLLLEILPSKSAKWRSFLKEKRCESEDTKVNGSGQVKELGRGGGSVKVQDKLVTDRGKTVQEKVMDKACPVQEEEDKGEPVQEGVVERGEVRGEEKKVVKKKKKKGKKKNKGGELKAGDESEMMVMGEENRSALEIPDLVCLCPLTAMGSATQRKIKLLYHEVVKSCESNRLTLAQVIEFTNCLAEAKEELENKADAIKRKFTIKKALLSKADRSSIERLRQQIYELEKQQKRLEEDAYVYNWLQQQLDLSPACKKLLETSTKMEPKTKSSKRQESKDADEFADISFEELLAQEKKDSFWQTNWKSRMCSR